MSTWWYLGEAFNWCHVVFMITVLLMGWLWIRPIWIWALIFMGTPACWRIFGGCPFTMLGDWLQSRQGDSFHMSFIHIYGLLWGMVIIVSLMLFGGFLGVWLAKRATGPIVSRSFDQKHRRDFGF